MMQRAENENEQQQTGGRRVVVTFEDPTARWALAAADLSGKKEEEGVILPHHQHTAGCRYKLEARRRRDAAEYRDSNGTYLIGIMHQVLVADENHTAQRV
jgi:hypothetical protein